MPGREALRPGIAGSRPQPRENRTAFVALIPGSHSPRLKKSYASAGKYHPFSVDNFRRLYNNSREIL
jgi:hypothetical protein